MTQKSLVSACPPEGQLKLIEDLGGTIKVVTLVNQKLGTDLCHQAVTQWKRRGHIPLAYRPTLAAEARRKKVPVPPGFLDFLKALKPRSRRAAA